ncbi:hypothetical protein GCM10020220_081240 [Nonomuraea rubra]
MSTPHIGLLGSIVIWHDRKEFNPGPPKQRALLAVLSMRLGEVISRDELIDAIWGDRPPATARSSLHTYVANLRRRLTPRRSPDGWSQPLTSNRSGYVLDLSPGGLDAWRFEDLLAQARQGRRGHDARTALAGYDRSLSMWRGTALLGAPGPFAEVERTRLAELRLIAMQERLLLLLELGRRVEALNDVTALVHQHPLNEHLRIMQMIILCRSGRQADAFRVFEETQRALAAELGIAPSYELRLCHEWMLRGNPELELRVTSMHIPGAGRPAGHYGGVLAGQQGRCH